jgi:hypothetical protein
MPSGNFLLPYAMSWNIPTSFKDAKINPKNACDKYVRTYSRQEGTFHFSLQKSFNYRAPNSEISIPVARETSSNSMPARATDTGPRALQLLLWLMQFGRGFQELSRRPWTLESLLQNSVLEFRNTNGEHWDSHRLGPITVQSRVYAPRYASSGWRWQ